MELGYSASRCAAIRVFPGLQSRRNVLIITLVGWPATKVLVDHVAKMWIASNPKRLRAQGVRRGVFVRWRTDLAAKSER